jgi:hypothetical protein
VLGLNRGVLITGTPACPCVVGQALRQWREGDAVERERQVHTIHMQPLADVSQAMLRYALAPGSSHRSSPPSPTCSTFCGPRN